MRNLLIVLLLLACGSAEAQVGVSNSPINFSGIASRTSGVAPLSVFFDATGTTDPTKTTRPFHDLQYTWTFGDPAGGATWANGSNPGKNSRNQATGPVAAHVFETPGTYTVTATVTDGTNQASFKTTITVTDPNVVFKGANTICIAAETSPVAGAGGCPVGAEVIRQVSFYQAVNTYAQTGKRVLFKRGDTFINDFPAVVSHKGPGIIGAYGTGANPIIKATGNRDIMHLSDKSTPTIGDWRIMDLEFDGLSGNNANGVVAEGGINQVLFLRMNIHNVEGGIYFAITTLDNFTAQGYPGQSIWDQISIVDSDVNTSLNYLIFLSASRYALLGSFVDNSLDAHVMRSHYLDKAIVSNNTVSRAAKNELLFKLHAPTWCDSEISKCNQLTDTLPVGVGHSGYTEDVVISDNKFVPAAGTPYSVAVAPQNATSDERLRNIILERNWFTAAANIQIALVMQGSEFTVRNNICDLTGSTNPGQACFGAEGEISWASPLASNIRIYNNTGHASLLGSSFSLVKVNAGSAPKNLSVINNLTNGPHATLISGTPGAEFVESNNSTNADLTKSLFTTNIPLIPLQFKPLTTGGGLLVPVWSDFYQVPVTGTHDIGAVH